MSNSIRIENLLGGIVEGFVFSGLDQPKSVVIAQVVYGARAIEIYVRLD